MWVTYAPEGESERRWEFNPGSIREVKAEMIEKRAETRFGEWIDDLLHGGARARRVLLWHLLSTHEHPGMKFEDVDFARGDLSVEQDVAELEKARASIVAADLDEDVRRVALSQCDEQIAESRAKFGGGDEQGKASLRTSVPDIVSPFPSTSVSAPGSSGTF